MTTHIPRPDYPTPQWERPEWLNLNGQWQFEEAADLASPPLERSLNGTITVPFAPESKLSGVGKTDFMAAVWYKRSFRIPESWQGRRMLLHFGAVDYDTTVWVNGVEVGKHRGGYTPFTFDITSQLKAGDNEVVVGAIDDTRSPLQPSGKQCHERDSYACFYTRTTGIWQTVWLEPVPQTYLARMRLVPDLDGKRVIVQVWTAGDAREVEFIAAADVSGDTVAHERVLLHGGWATAVLKLPHAHAWSPDDPFLYGLQLTLVAGDQVVDTVRSYFGLRSVTLKTPAICINNKPVFQRLVLDQGFYPDGIYTAPSDDALRRDIELSKAMGFNGARLHEKVFEPRFLYWADKLGYLVWGEFPDWGLDKSKPEALEVILPQWLEAIERDYNHPSIIGWCPLNESDSGPRPELFRTLYRATKAVDPTRPVIDTSGYIHVETDVDDVHTYEQDVTKFAALFEPFAQGDKPWRCFPQDAPYQGQPYFVSEYGGIWWHPGHPDGRQWGYGISPDTEDAFVARYRGMTETLLRHPRTCGFCYTQLYDIEFEVNGLYTDDRKPKFDPAVIRAINNQKAAIEKK